MSKSLNRLLICLFISLFSTLQAQELPPIQTYSPQDYNGETQNWSIAQDSSKTMYFANNKGLLTFNGEHWRIYPSPNQSIIRSLHIANNRIYSGMYMEFGYWQKDNFGLLEYTSLSKKLNSQLIEDEQFWKIISLQDWVLFQSLNRIYIYNIKNESFKIIESETGITKMFKTNENIYFQKTGKGLFKIENGRDVLISDVPQITTVKFANVFDQKDKLLIQTQDHGFFILENGELKVWNKDVNNFLNDKSIYSATILKNSNYALGTISHGIVILNSNGNIKYSIDQSQGLGNNTILSLFEDIDGNLWLGTDNGISCINLQAPFQVYSDYNGLLGSVYTSEIFGDKLFIGTNQGLFCKNLNDSSNFEFVEGTQGQVWSLMVYDQKLFCGHDSGTFLLSNDTVEKIASIEGTWNIKPVPSKTDELVQGNYSGLYVLKKIGSNWTLKHKVRNFDISSRFFEFISRNEIVVSHEYKGVVNLTLNEDLSRVDSIKIDKSIKGLKSSLTKHNNDIIYAFEKGIFKYDQVRKDFKIDSLLSKTLNQNGFVTGKLVPDKKSNRLWLFSNDKINYIEPGNLSSIPKIKSVPLPYQLIQSVSGYENLLALDNNKYLMGTTSGYLILELDKLQNKMYNVNINSISNTNNRNDIEANNVSMDSKGNFTNDKHNLEFTYSINEYEKYFNAEYQYQLLGIYDQWSPWSSESRQVFENLPYGDYTFNLRGRVNGELTGNVASYSFNVKRPWYLSKIMLALYILALLILIFTMHSLYRQYYKKQRERLLDNNKKEIELKELENQKRIMRIQNENLEQDIENKNRELAISTMSLIKKNEFLNTVKQELKKSTSEIPELNQVIRIIDKNLNNTDDWKLFEEAFNNADKDFLKKIKNKHDSLTSNDLRLCAYLRLNLSSKEIAPLLNISPRSVEVKRYRLRKKMNLPHETSLTSYILEI